MRRGINRIDQDKTARKLRYLRTENGYRLQDIASKLDVTESAVAQWELYGLIPTANHFIQLSELYGVPLDDLIFRKAVC